MFSPTEPHFDRLIRLTKRAFQDAWISMPDEAREMIFPHGVPVKLVDEKETEKSSSSGSPSPQKPTETESPSDSTTAEAGLSSESKKLKQQSREAWQPGDGEILSATLDTNFLQAKAEIANATGFLRNYTR